jgi:hypothetical protein
MNGRSGITKLTKVTFIVRERRESRGLVERRALTSRFGHLGRKREGGSSLSTSKSRNEGLGVGRKCRALLEVRISPGWRIFLPGG